MTLFPRLTLATLLMGSLALPAFALDVSSPKDGSITATTSPTALSQTTKQAPATKRTVTAGKSSLKSGVHKAAATSEIPATVSKGPAATGVTGLPSKDAKAKDAATGMGQEAAKLGTVKTPAPAPAQVTKTN